jgi:hypothetical protein
MKNFELKLDPHRIKYLKECERRDKEQKENTLSKQKLTLRLREEKKLHEINLAEKPSFNKLRPNDKELQQRHEIYRLSPISNTPRPQSLLQMQNDTNSLKNNQDAAIKFNMALRKRLLRDNLARKHYQDKLINDMKI